MTEEFPEMMPCKHLDFEARDEDEVGWATCRTCGTHIRIHEAFNNLQKAVYAEYLRLSMKEKET